MKSLFVRQQPAHQSRSSSPRVRRGIAPLVSLALAGLLGAGSVVATPLPPLAPNVTDGTYTVTPQGCSPLSATTYCVGQWLEERVGSSGSWQSVDGSFVGKPPGTYAYRTVQNQCDFWYGWCYTQYSGAVTVVVTGGTAPPAEPLEAQLRYRYRVRQGNVTGDYRPELLIERISGPADGRGAIDKVLLQPAGSNAFQTAIPTAAQLGSGIWQASNVRVAVNDMNADGYADLAVTGMSAAVPGAEDQIVFASGSAWDARPQHVQAFDPSLRRFTREMRDYVADNNYFLDNAPLLINAFVYRFSYCPPSSGIAENSMIHVLQCASVLYVNYYVSLNYTVFDGDAVDTWRDELAVAAGDLPQGTAAERIARRIENAIGVEIGGWDLHEIFGTEPGIDDPAERRGLDGFLAVIGIGNAWGQDGADDGADEDSADGVPGPRGPDRIYIVARYLFGSSVNKMHTALLYHMPVTGVPTWYGAYDSDERALYDGVLTARTNSPKDSPLLMPMTLGEAIPPSGEPRFTYFFVNMLAAHDHYRGLPSASRARYDAIPEIPCGGCNGRNSNGYVHGLIAATNGRPQPVPGINLDGLAGWEYPVERHYYGR